MQYTYTLIYFTWSIVLLRTDVLIHQYTYTAKYIEPRAVIDSTDIDISTHILKYRYIDTRFKISIYQIEKFLRKLLSFFFHEQSLFSSQWNVYKETVLLLDRLKAFI